MKTEIIHHPKIVKLETISKLEFFMLKEDCKVYEVVHKNTSQIKAVCLDDLTLDVFSPMREVVKLKQVEPAKFIEVI